MYKNILVPVLFDEEHDTQASFLVARALAGEGAKFTVVHVLETIPNYVTSEIPKEVLARTRHGRAIVDYADENDIDCIVLASHRPGFGDIFLGSTASRVVRHAKCSVHVIR